MILVFKSSVQHYSDKDVENSSMQPRVQPNIQCRSSFLHPLKVSAAFAPVSLLTDPCRTQFKCSERQIDRKDSINSWPYNSDLQFIKPQAICFLPFLYVSLIHAHLCPDPKHNQYCLNFCLHL